MPSKLDPYVVTIENWIAEEPQLTAIAIVGRLSEKHPDQFGRRQHSIVQRLLKVLRKKASGKLLALGATAAAPAGAVAGSGYRGPDPPTARGIERASKSPSCANVGLPVPMAPPGNVLR